MKMPFTTEQFFDLFEKYNVTVYPAQLIIGLLGLLAILLLHSAWRYRHKFIGGYLGLLWIWIGFAYHITFFTEINPAAFIFGFVFMLQGVLLLIATFIGNRLKFTFRPVAKNFSGYFFILFGLLIYPMISYLATGSLAKTIAIGLPCPSTILTFGFLMMTQSKFSKYLLIIPTLWAIVGISAAINFGVYQDLMILVAALFADYYLLKKSKAGHFEDPALQY